MTTRDREGELEDRIGQVLAASGLDPVLAHAILEGSPDLPSERTLALIALDPIGIQRQVLASRRFVTRLGASDALRRWDARTRCIDGAACLYAGGGQAVLLAPASLGETLASSRQSDFRSAHLGELGTAVRLCSPRELAQGPDPVPLTPEARAAIEALGLAPSGGGFGGLLRQLHELLRANKDARHRTGSLQGRPCTECGTRQGVHTLGNELLCRTCQAMREESKDSEHRKEAQTFDDLGESRKLAFLYIDGTGVGRALAQQKTLKDYARFSRKLDEAFSWESVQQDLSSAGVDRMIPVVRGGDDLGLVFGADQGKGAWRAALAVIGGLQERLHEIEVGVGAGLVVTRSLGARQAMELAGRLVGSAKRRGRLTGRTVSAIDFERVDGGTVLCDSLPGLRKDRAADLELPRGWADFPRRRIAEGRPYLLEEAQQLAEVVEGIEGEDWGTIYRLAEQLEQNFVSGAVYATYVLHKRPRLCQRLGATAGAPWLRDQGWLWAADPDPARTDTVRLRVHDLLDIHRILREVSR